MLKEITKTTAVILLTFCLSGCHKMYFHNGANTSTMMTQKKLHHELVYELIEISPPVNLKSMCQNKEWQTVEVERTFLNGLITGLQPVYGQWTVNESCK